VRIRDFASCNIMSFESPWRWTDGQFAASKSARDVDAGTRVPGNGREAQQHTGSEKKESAGRARSHRELKPDLVYTSDDDAQAFVTRHYAERQAFFCLQRREQDAAAHGLQADQRSGRARARALRRNGTVAAEPEADHQAFAVISDLGQYWPT